MHNFKQLNNFIKVNGTAQVLKIMHVFKYLAELRTFLGDIAFQMQ